MKIINSVAFAYNNQFDLYNILKGRIDTLINTIKDPNWFYFSRVKALESYALKLETGRFDAMELEDFFACTLVVRSQREIKIAVTRLKKYCKIHYQKPKLESVTHKEPDSFVFDDLRIYASLKKEPSLPSGPINDLVFEVQIKTFLQHAWSIATHDLIYKSDEVNWSKNRIAYQIKAMLENAEISILKAEKSKKVTGLPKENFKYQELQAIKNFIDENWTPVQLPTDKLRLTQNVYSILLLFKLKVEDLKKILEAESALGRGIKITNLPPYLIIVQSLIYQKPEKVKNYILSGTGKGRLACTDEMEFAPLGIPLSKLKSSTALIFI
jgi:hypothetical protein